MVEVTMATPPTLKATTAIFTVRVHAVSDITFIVQSVCLHHVQLPRGLLWSCSLADHNHSEVTHWDTGSSKHTQQLGQAKLHCVVTVGERGGVFWDDTPCLHRCKGVNWC